MKFTFNNTTHDILYVQLFQEGFCHRLSDVEKFKLKTSKQFYTAEGSFCNPSGNWVLTMGSHVYAIMYHFKVTKPNGECQMTTASGKHIGVSFSGNCKRTT